MTRACRDYNQQEARTGIMQPEIGQTPLGPSATSQTCISVPTCRNILNVVDKSLAGWPFPHSGARTGH